MIILDLLTIDDWSETSAEVVETSLDHPHATQKDIAAKLSIPQSRVSERLSRAGYEPIVEMEKYYRALLVNKAAG